ncbi:UNVERIFIED_CONTAM: hypothetical protein GTU68_042019 [Idotea baltica]|nr:hypothetical protein [Idotea baltica]
MTLGTVSYSARMGISMKVEVLILWVRTLWDTTLSVTDSPPLERMPAKYRMPLFKTI